MIRIIILILFLTGCAWHPPSSPVNKPELKPSPPENLCPFPLFDLLHQDESNSIAYKSITKEDYETKETC
jgi:hypothetical protein